jgi:hypothetical protein
MRRLTSATLIVAATLAGCAENQFAGSLVYMAPYGYERLDCGELKKRAAAADNRVKASQSLMDRASGSAAGPIINNVVYGPDYSKARWDQRFYDQEIARRNCDPPAPLSLEPPAEGQVPGR